MNPIGAAIVTGIMRGFGFLEGSKRCLQCYKPRPLEDFIGTRGGIVGMCVDCRARYRNWTAKTEDEKAAARPPVLREGTGSRVSLALRSGNRKTGPIPVSMTDMRSCPPSCPHLDRGCYAGYGKNAHHWRNVAKRGHTWRAFVAAIAGLPEGQLWRHNEAGDLPGVGDRLDRRALAQLVAANAGRRGFTFTHKPLRSPADRAAVLEANRAGFRINLSADSLEDADRLADLGIGPVAVVLPSDAPHRASRTPAGRAVVVCPAVTCEGMTCERCGLCQKDRRSIVGFPAHGQAARLVTLRLRR